MGCAERMSMRINEIDIKNLALNLCFWPQPCPEGPDAATGLTASVVQVLKVANFNHVMQFVSSHVAFCT